MSSISTSSPTLAEIDEDPLLDLLDAAVAAALLVESGIADRYRFAHALIQHSLYDELSPSSPSTRPPTHRRGPRNPSHR